MNIYLTTFIAVYIYLIGFILGTVFGSFINCQAYRIAHGEKWWTGRSHCANCNHPLNALDLVPILSYLFLRGRCRYCKEKISPRYILTELMMGLLFVGLIFTAGELSFALLMNMGLVVILLGLSLVDLDTMEIPNGYILFGIFWWLGIVIANGVYQFLHVTESVDKQGVLKASAYYFLWHLFAGVIIAGMILILSLIMDRLLQKESMGGGDIKLLFMVSLYLGIYQGLFMLIMSCLIGLLVVVITKKDKIPFGPAIAAGTYLGLTIGIPITNWYIGLL